MNKIDNLVKNLRVVKKKTYHYTGCSQYDHGRGSKCIRLVLEDKETREVWAGTISLRDREWILGKNKEKKK